MLIKADPRLDRMRQDLVPDYLEEETFWRNYFY